MILENLCQLVEERLYECGLNNYLSLFTCVDKWQIILEVNQLSIKDIEGQLQQIYDKNRQSRSNCSEDGDDNNDGVVNDDGIENDHEEYIEDGHGVDNGVSQCKDESNMLIFEMDNILANEACMKTADAGKTLILKNTNSQTSGTNEDEMTEIKNLESDKVIDESGDLDFYDVVHQDDHAKTEEIEIEHEKSGSRYYRKCDLCEYKTWHSGQMKKHVLHSHFKCSLCEFAGKLSISLKV